MIICIKRQNPPNEDYQVCRYNHYFSIESGNIPNSNKNIINNHLAFGLLLFSLPGT
jgi:hypothetical protein